MKYTESIETAIRMVGQLLLHRPTTGGMFKRTNGLLETPLFQGPKDLPKDACAFCYVGAVNATAVSLDMSREHLWDSCNDVVGNRMFEGVDWDNASAKRRKQIAKKLANYRETK